MNEYYKKPVILLGLVVPVLVMLLLMSSVYYGHSKLNKSYQVKKLSFDKAEKARQNTLDLQVKVAMNNNELVKWEGLLANENRGTFVDHWKEAEQKFSGKELTRTPHTWLNYSPGIGKDVKQPSSQVTMAFSATYRAMQATLMEVESKLPQMQLDSISMKPDEVGGRVNFTTKFTIWTQN